MKFFNCFMLPATKAQSAVYQAQKPGVKNDPTQQLHNLLRGFCLLYSDMKISDLNPCTWRSGLPTKDDMPI